MDKLDALFKTGFHTIEKSDTWLGIRRQDQGEHRKPKDHSKPDEDGEFGEDHTTLSVAALQGFLHQLLDQAGVTRTDAPDTMPVAAINPELEDSASPDDPRYRAAANAYQSTAHHTHPAPHTPRAQDDTNAPSITLSTEEIRTIQTMLEDVGVLIKRNIATITLIPAPTFLESLGNGVRDALEAGR